MRLFKRGARITAYRSVAGTPGGFVAAHPQFFEQQPNALVIDDLRMQIVVEKHVDSEPNTATVIVTNASPTTRADLQHKPLIVRIDAGYDGELRHLFTGDLRWGCSQLDGTDWLTRLQLGDGDRAYRHARVSRSYKAGTQVITALREAAAAMGLILDSRTAVSQDLQAQFASGRTLQGPARDELTRLLAPYGYHWSIQNGKMQVLKDAQTRQDQAILVTEETGLVGTPEFATPDKSGQAPTLTLKMLLYPELTPGGQIQVRSRSVDGIFRVERVTHTIDTCGDEFESEIEATKR